MKTGKLYKGKALFFRDSNNSTSQFIASFTCLLLESFDDCSFFSGIKSLRIIIDPETSIIISSKIEMVDIKWFKYNCKKFDKDYNDYLEELPP